MNKNKIMGGAKLNYLVVLVITGLVGSVVSVVYLKPHPEPAEQPVQTSSDTADMLARRLVAEIHQLKQNLTKIEAELEAAVKLETAGEHAHKNLPERLLKAYRESLIEAQRYESLGMTVVNSERHGDAIEYLRQARERYSQIVEEFFWATKLTETVAIVDGEREKLLAMGDAVGDWKYVAAVEERYHEAERLIAAKKIRLAELRYRNLKQDYLSLLDVAGIVTEAKRHLVEKKGAWRATLADSGLNGKGFVSKLIQSESDVFQILATAQNLQEMKDVATSLASIADQYESITAKVESWQTQRRRAHVAERSWHEYAQRYALGTLPAFENEIEERRLIGEAFSTIQQYKPALAAWQGIEQSYLSLWERAESLVESRNLALTEQALWLNFVHQYDLGPEAGSKAERLFEEAEHQAKVGDFNDAGTNYQQAIATWRDGYSTALIDKARPKMVVIPAGRFRMGDITGNGQSDELPVHWVDVRSFALSRTEVTFAEYDAYASLTGRDLPDDQGWGRGDRPVINVSWEDAQSYAQWLSKRTGAHYRLPTEVEWEYAARAGTSGDYSWGDEAGGNNASCEGCNAWNNTGTVPVAQFRANGYGLYDMLGNVWEWVEDCPAAYTETALKSVGHPPGKCDHRGLRGGSWYDMPPALRVSNRSEATPDFRSNRIGFRLAQDQ